MLIFKLYIALLEDLMYSIEQKKYGHPGILTTKGQLAARLGCSVEEIQQAAYELDNWSDFNKLPSLTCLMRVPASVSGKPHYFDIHTQMVKEGYSEKIQRHLLTMVRIADAGTEDKPVARYRVQAKDGVDIQSTVDIPLDVETAVLERDLCEKFYGRLSHTALDINDLDKLLS